MSNRLYQGKKVRELDSVAIKTFNLAPLELMTRAAQAAFEFVRTTWPLAKRFAIVCGTGNNAGDGLVLAKYLLEDDFIVEIYGVSDTFDDFSDTAQLALQDLKSLNCPIKPLPDRLEHVDVIVDALLGTGLRAPLKEIWAQAITLMNRSERPIFSLDVPSGVDADTGGIVGEAVYAQATLTFVGQKYALLTGPAQNYVGHLAFNDLGIPAEVYERVAFDGQTIELNEAQQALKPRRKAAHKGEFGHVVILGGGTPGMSGAVGLAGMAALCAGAGKVSAMVHPEALPLMGQAPLEMMCHSLEDDQGVLENGTVFLVGPGMTQSGWAKKCFEKALEIEKPLVIDADGLNLLAQNPQRRDNWVLTPHPGEAARLLKVTVETIESDRVAALRQIQAEYGGVVILKGAGTLIQSSPEAFYLNQTGNPGMASGGMGDVLSGLIASLIAQGLPLEKAAQLAVVVHGTAGDIEQSLGERGMLASDLMLHIRNLLNPMNDHEHAPNKAKNLLDF